MDLTRALDETELLADGLWSVVEGPLFDDAPRFQVADVACSLALEHWDAVRGLIQATMLPSSLIIHRAQFEAVLRSVRLTRLLARVKN